MHAGWIVIHGWGTTLNHTWVHVRHHHPPRVKVHGQMWRTSHRTSWVQCRLLRAWLWCGTRSWALLRCLGLELSLGSLTVLLLPLLLLFQELLLCANKCHKTFTCLPKSNQYYEKNTTVLQNHTTWKYNLKYLLYISAGVVA